ncbi:recombinase family protein [Sphingomonas sanguinis]|uniref:recombinase family protein n=1 Tax=Sphingomonas sanguinis TaxID=33051 RepID=UPI0009EF3CC9|nr:recombinase family protein [Sphingomonas sanguinis]
MTVGYARVSTEEQKLDLQISALEAIGCNRIYQDHGMSGYSFEREGLEAALASLKPGGTLVVWRLDRLGRSLSGLVQLIDMLGKRRVNFRSIMENIDTASSGGRLMFHMMAALAEFERALIGERTKAGLAEAKARGQHVGRPRMLTPAQIEDAITLVRHAHIRLSEVAERLNVSTRTLQRCIRERGAAGGCGNCDLPSALGDDCPRRGTRQKSGPTLQ